MAGSSPWWGMVGGWKTWDFIFTFLVIFSLIHHLIKTMLMHHKRSGGGLRRGAARPLRCDENLSQRPHLALRNMSSASSSSSGGAQVSEKTTKTFFKGVRTDQVSRYKLLNHVGRGACAHGTDGPPPRTIAALTARRRAADGEVWAASRPDRPAEKVVAIKKITQVFSQVTEAKRILRELRILRHLRHPNIIRCATVPRPPARRAPSECGGAAQDSRLPAPAIGEFVCRPVGVL